MGGNPARPDVVILGVSKISGKIDFIRNIMKKVDAMMKDDIEKDTRGWREAERREAKRIAKDAELLEKDAKLVKSRVDDSKPTSAEYRTLAERAGRIDAYVVNHALPTASASMDTIRAAIAKLNQAFGM